MSPTARTLKKLRDEGWTAGVVERFNHHTMRRHDLFGCIDIVAIKGDVTLGVQATSDLTGGNSSARLEKIVALPEARDWLFSGSRRLEIWAWRKLKVKRGGKLMTWQPKITAVLPTMLASFDPANQEG